MNNLDLTPILENVCFTDRYKILCLEHDNFENRMRGLNNEMYTSVLNKFSYKAEYYKKEKFYTITQIEGDHSFFLQLVLFDGIVEPSLNVKLKESYYSPYGRFDFIPGKMGLEFDRKKYNLPKYSDIVELEAILSIVFSIYEDIKTALLNKEKSDENLMS